MPDINVRYKSELTSKPQIFHARQQDARTRDAATARSPSRRPPPFNAQIEALQSTLLDTCPAPKPATSFTVSEPTQPPQRLLATVLLQTLSLVSSTRPGAPEALPFTSHGNRASTGELALAPFSWKASPSLDTLAQYADGNSLATALEKARPATSPPLFAPGLIYDNPHSRVKRVMGTTYRPVEIPLSNRAMSRAKAHELQYREDGLNPHQEIDVTDGYPTGSEVPGDSRHEWSISLLKYGLEHHKVQNSLAITRIVHDKDKQIAKEVVISAKKADEKHKAQFDKSMQAQVIELTLRITSLLESLGVDTTSTPATIFAATPFPNDPLFATLTQGQYGLVVQTRAGGQERSFIVSTANWQKNPVIIETDDSNWRSQAWIHANAEKFFGYKMQRVFYRNTLADFRSVRSAAPHVATPLVAATRQEQWEAAWAATDTEKYVDQFHDELVSAVSMPVVDMVTGGVGKLGRLAPKLASHGYTIVKGSRITSVISKGFSATKIGRRRYRIALRMKRKEHFEVKMSGGRIVGKPEKMPLYSGRAIPKPPRVVAAGSVGTVRNEAIQTSGMFDCTTVLVQAKSEHGDAVSGLFHVMGSNLAAGEGRGLQKMDDLIAIARNNRDARFTVIFGENNGPAGQTVFMTQENNRLLPLFESQKYPFRFAKSNQVIAYPDGTLDLGEGGKFITGKELLKLTEEIRNA
ncbi:hypothetical protein [Paraburkholderia humisilvae]|uniref:Uncharacterized protein n=1 Tax=Paraburkholderia humisilvae TaxID=627669 RepID=A0A6J5F3I5_9BURK|nr:hypothetical protein [Paraburkholderia humisilvae]CAB3773308.1 hypothetical protein LMG29542_07184 [Paraburkholderia humisilvae]